MTRRARPELGELCFQRRAVRGDPRDQRPDPTDLRARAGGGDDEAPAPGGDRRAPVNHARPVAQGRPGVEDGIRGLGDGQGLSRERGLVDLEARLLDHPPVGMHAVPLREEHDVAGDEVGRLDLMVPAVPDDAGERDGLLAKPVEGRGGLPFRDEADGGVEEDHDEDGPGLDAFPERQGDAAGGDEQHHHQALELMQEDLQRGSRRGLRQRVGAVTG